MVVAISLHVTVRDGREQGDSLEVAFIRRAAPWAAALAVFVCVDVGVATMNLFYYGEYETVEVKAPYFLRAYGALARIRPENWSRYVVFPKDARERAYAVSPAARELRQSLDGTQGRAWRDISCSNQQDVKPCSEILAGWFLWALRDAVAEADITSPRRLLQTFTRGSPTRSTMHAAAAHCRATGLARVQLRHFGGITSQTQREKSHPF